MEDDRTIFRTKWVKITGIVLLLIIVLRFGRTIILDIGLLEPERLHEQYIQEIKQIDGNIFGEDSLLLKYEYEVEEESFDRKYTFNSDDCLFVSYDDKIHLSLYVDDSFDAMPEKEQIEYLLYKQSQFAGCLPDINTGTHHPVRSSYTHFKYKPNFTYRTTVDAQILTEKFIYRYYTGYADLYDVKLSRTVNKQVRTKEAVNNEEVDSEE